MRSTGWFLVVLILSWAIPSLAQSSSPSSPTVEITGVILSFSGNTLDVKPATTPAVWVTLPTGLSVDRSRLKPGVEVSVEARWAEVCYIASQVTIRN